MKTPATIPDAALPVIKPVGEDAVLVEFEAEISLEVNRKVRRLAHALERANLPGAREIVPTYRSLLVYFDPEHSSFEQVAEVLRREAGRKATAALPPARLFRVPTIYSEAHGPDLARVAETTRLTPQQVIELFSTLQYPVYCLGFLCCLAYLGGVPKALHLPRLATPRTFLPAGSVGFAGGQAVVLPIDQPSGWNYIGRSFVTFYDPSRFPPTAIRPGDLVTCPSVSEEEARAWQGRPLGDCLIDGPAGS